MADITPSRDDQAIASSVPVATNLDFGETSDSLPQQSLFGDDGNDAAEQRIFKPRSSRHSRPGGMPETAHPTFVDVDIDAILIHRGLDRALNEAGINFVHPPLNDLLTEAALRRMAYREPIQVDQCDGYYRCFGGKQLLHDAQRVLHAPRIFPVLLWPRRALSSEELVEEILVEEVILPIWHRIPPKQLRTFVMVALRIATRFRTSFQPHKKAEWAFLLNVAERSFRFNSKDAPDETK